MSQEANQLNYAFLKLGSNAP